jgi:glycosyltransferase involved in cell wall biosynthesis
MAGVVRIGIDGKVLSLDAGGIGRYAVGLLRSLLSLGKEAGRQREFVVFTGPQTDRRLLETLPGAFSECRVPVRSSLLRASLALPRAMERERIDLFHGLDHVGAPLRSTATRRVITLHDILPISHPEWFKLKHRTVVRLILPRAVRRADRVIVPSEFVKRSVLERGLVEEERLRVVPEGFDSRFHPRRDRTRMITVLRKYGLSREYVLFVGTLEPRKNLATLLNAFEKLGERDIVLVVVGSPGWGGSSLGAGSGRVRMLGFVDDEDLPDLYRGARLFVLPSLAEGFGLTVLEAMASGTPVIASNLSAIPEVVGDAAILVKPTRVEALTEAMRRVLDDGDLARRLAADGLRRARRFSWNRAARSTLALYDEVLG